MKEIKFKAWNKKEKRGEDTAGITLDMESGKIYQVENGEIADFPDENLIPVQYAGFKDKNDKEIYRGDIVKFKLWNKQENEWYSEPFVIKFGYYKISYDCGGVSGKVSLGAYGFYLALNNKTFRIDEDCQKDIEIIDNIYENPRAFVKRR